MESNEPILPTKPLSRSFFLRSPDRVAQELLGVAILRQTSDGKTCGGLIVETEAYLSTGDPASHSHRGPKPRCASMFAIGGTLYVYSIHAKHCLNVVTEKQGQGSAVLIRAIEPLWGVAEMHQRRGPQKQERQLTSGPGMLCQAMDVDRRLDGVDLLSGETIYLARTTMQLEFEIRRTTRIGVTSGQNLRLRNFVDGNRFTSGKAADHSKPRRTRLCS